MAGLNGKLSEKVVTEWFKELEFDRQNAFLTSLAEAHETIRANMLGALRKQMAALEGGPAKRGRPAGKARLVKKLKGKVTAKYRDPKTGDTWSGRGRMASWLSAKVDAGEKQDKYLIK